MKGHLLFLDDPLALVPRDLDQRQDQRGDHKVQAGLGGGVDGRGQAAAGQQVPDSKMTISIP